MSSFASRFSGLILAAGIAFVVGGIGLVGPLSAASPASADTGYGAYGVDASTFDNSPTPELVAIR